MNYPIYIKSKRLILREFELKDATFVHEYAKNINVSKYVTWNTHNSVNDSIDYIKRSILSYRLCRISNLAIAIFENGNEKVIGSTGLFQRSQTSPFTYELGYVLSETYWNKGYAREAVTTLINYAFQNFKIERIEAFCISNNIQSFKLMEKIGMQREGLLRNHYMKNGIIYNSYIYSILNSEWNSFR